jgi:hypothetical protein
MPGNGGPHGQRLMRQYVYSRFRPGKACRDPEGMVFTTAAFVTRQFERLLIGEHSCVRPLQKIPVDLFQGNPTGSPTESCK